MKDGKPEVVAYLYNNTVNGNILDFEKADHYWLVPYSDKPHDYIQGQPLIRLSDHEAVVAELEADRRRLEFMIAKEAQVGWNREGEYCGVYASDGEDGYECLSGFGSFHESARAAIDAAMKK